MVWLGVWAAAAVPVAAGIAAASLTVVGVARRRAPWLVLGLVMGAAVAAGVLGAARRSATLAAPIPAGPVTLEGRVADDPRSYGGEFHFPLDPSAVVGRDGTEAWRGPRLLVSSPPTEIAAGEMVRVVGTATPGGGRYRGDPVAGRLEARSVEVVAPPGDPLFRIGNLLRERVHDGLDGFDGRPDAALLAGFLIGDVRELPAVDAEELRLAGLSHFVAVSGSNVALFLAAWWIAAGPLGWTPRRRAVVGLIGLAVFVVVTRWEPSVVRAGTMAALVLGGRLAGIPIDPWTALGGAVALLLLVSPELIGDVGFQLSVAATAGVILGAGWFAGRRPRWAWTALGATLAAQAAVAPLLLAHFGSVPLFSPLANVAAAPLVALATSIGGIGVITGVGPVVALGLVPSRVVLAIAGAAADLPQLDTGGAVLAAAMMLAARSARLRPIVALGAAAVVAGTTVLPVVPPAGPLLEVLDVGQGDAVLLRGPAGEVILVDGGPDPARLRAELRNRRVRRIDLLVVTHHHADHAGGLVGLTSAVTVGTVWMADRFGPGPDPLGLLAAELHAAGATIEAPSPGWRAEVGAYTVSAIGPRRRYAGANDGSIVLLVETAGRTVLLPGDIESIAQRELGPVPADVMKVPHQGAATSDLEWLRASAPAVAVISVGPNDFGHPSPDVVEVLEGAGAVVHRTDWDGTVAIRLDEL